MVFCPCNPVPLDDFREAAKYYAFMGDELFAVPDQIIEKHVHNALMLHPEQRIVNDYLRIGH
jgi:hypothetical protein